MDTQAGRGSTAILGVPLPLRPDDAASPMVGATDLPGPGLAALLASGFAPLLLDTYRQPPRQARAVDTVEALLLAADRLFQRRGLAGISMDALVREANVSQQAAYRYFENADHLLRALIRYLQARNMATLMDRMARQRFGTVADIAAFTLVEADAIFAQGVARYPVDWHKVYRTHHEICYDGIALLAEATRAALIRDHLAGPGTLVQPIAAGLVGLIGGVKLLRRQDPAIVGQAARNTAIDQSYASALAAGLEPPAAVPFCATLSHGSAD